MYAGQVIGERYRVVGRAGEGGAGTVFHCRDLNTDQDVAVKVLNRSDEDDVRRFLKEAEWLAEFSHPGIVRHLAHGQSQDGRYFLVMEWLEGESLTQWLITRLAWGASTPA